MVRRLFTVLLALTTLSLHAQDESGRFVHQGLLRAQGTIAVGFMHSDFKNIYFHGDIGYHVSDDIELRGDGYFSMGSIGDSTKFNMNHSIFSGGFYHFKTDGKLDPYVGLQPGIGISEYLYSSTDVNGEQIISEKAFSPLIGTVVGINYYGPKIFHLFMNVRFVHGKHISNLGSYFLDEFRISFGLGWNLN
jgi:hypothetical protein